MKKSVISLMLFVLYSILFSDVLVDMKFRTDDFYANTSFELFNPDPTWGYRIKVMSDAMPFHYKHDQNGQSYGSGAWYNQALEIFFDESEYLLASNDPVFGMGKFSMQLNCWEDDNGDPLVYDDGDDDHVFGWSRSFFIFNYPQAEWSDINDNGYIEVSDYSDDIIYRIEMDVWWQYSLPGQIEGQVSVIDNNSVLITKTNDNNYMIESWDYEISSTEDFINILYSGTTSDDSVIISDINATTVYYSRIRGSNTTGTGEFNNVLYVPSNFQNISLENIDSRTIKVNLENLLPGQSSWDCQVATDSEFNDLVYNESNITENEVTLEELSFNSIYYIKTRARDDDQVGEYTDTKYIRCIWLGDGSEESPYLIKNIYDLQNINTSDDYRESNYLQTNNIDASDTSNWNDGTGFIPIGKNYGYFGGLYDGQSYTIDNLFIDISDNEVGLFNNVYSGNLRNINITNATVSGDDKTGLLTGILSASTIDNCHVSGTVEGIVFVGGIAGYSLEASIRSSSSDVIVNATSQYSGGLVGYTSGNISNCHSSGTINGASNTGGFVGTSVMSLIDSCYTDCSVLGTTGVGGFIGVLGYHTSDIIFSINGCFSDATVQGNSYVGGFCGLSSSGNIINNSYAEGSLSGENHIGSFIGLENGTTIQNCYSANSIGVEDDLDNGFIGSVSSTSEGSYSNNYFSLEETGQTSGRGAIGLTQTQMHNPLTFINAGWDYPEESENGDLDIWAFEPYQNPRLAWESGDFITDYAFIPLGVEYSVSNIDNSSIEMLLENTNGYEVTSWDYQVSTDTLFTNIVVSGSSSDNSLTLEELPLLNESDYYSYRFKAFNDYGESEFSNVTYAVPNNLSAEMVINENGVFRINKLGNNNYRVVSWDYELADNSSFNNILASGNSSDAFVEIDNVPAINDDEYYCWRIRGLNETGYGNYSQPFYFSPQELVVEMFEVDSSRLKIELTSKNNYKVDQWEYQLSLDSSFNEILYSATTTDDYVYVEDLDLANYYFIRYKSSNSCGESDYYFGAYALPSEIETNIFVVNDNSLRIDIVEDNDYRITSWDYQLSNDENFVSIVSEQTNISDDYILIEDIDTSQYYYSRIKARNEDGESDYQFSSYLTPENTIFEVTKIDANSLLVEKIDNNGYLVTSWDLRVLYQGQYQYIAEEENISGSSFTIENINSDQELLVYTKARNIDRVASWILTSHLIPSVYIDYKIRTDDFYADVSSELGNPDPTWTYNCKIGNSDWLGVQTTHDQGSLMYGQGAWYEQEPNEVWSGSVMLDNTTITLDFKCWEDDRGSEITYDDGDDDYASGSFMKSSILNYPMSQWNRLTNYSQDYFFVGSSYYDNLYRIELDFYWEYTIPESYEASLVVIDSNTLVINKTNSGNYRVTAWDYQLSSDAEFTNIVSEASDLTGDDYTISNIDTQQYYYLRIRESNETGYGEYYVGTYAEELELPLSAPTNLVIIITGNAWQISWEQVDNAEYYIIESSSDLINWQEEGQTQEISYSVQNVRNEVRFFRVKAR